MLVAYVSDKEESLKTTVRKWKNIRDGVRWSLENSRSLKITELAETSDARYICTISMYKRVTPSQPSQQRGRLDLSRFVIHDALTHKVILTQGEWRNVVRVQFLFLLKV